MPKAFAGLLAACCLAGSLSSQAADAAQAWDPKLREALVESINQANGFNDRFEAEVWMVDMSTRLEPFLEDYEDRLKLLRTVHREATRNELQPELVLGVIEVESRFERFAISRAGARGLMQIMPFWLEEIGTLEAYDEQVKKGHLTRNLFHLETNIWFGCAILRHYLDVERGNISRALARYNGSVGQNWYPGRVLGAVNKRWRRQ